MGRERLDRPSEIFVCQGLLGQKARVQGHLGSADVDSTRSELLGET